MQHCVVLRSQELHQQSLEKENSKINDLSTENLPRYQNSLPKTHNLRRGGTTPNHLGTVRFSEETVPKLTVAEEVFN